MKKNLKILLILILIFIIPNLSSCFGGDYIIIYTAAEDERNNFIQEKLSEKFPETEIILQSLGTGNLVSKLQAEGKITDCDIFYDLEASNAEKVIDSNPNLFLELSYLDFSIYDEKFIEYTSNHKKYAINGKVNAGILINKELLNKYNLPIPKEYKDLLNPIYKDLISMPNPISSGTGYCFYNGIVSMYGEEKGLEYFEKLEKNVKEFTNSGSAPVKSVQRGDVAIGIGLLWQCIKYSNENQNLEYIILENKSPYNLFTMGIINGHENNPMVKEIFEFLYYELNPMQVISFNPDKLYVNQGEPLIPNYPKGYEDIKMNGLFDFDYKTKLLDKWKY